MRNLPETTSPERTLTAGVAIVFVLSSAKAVPFLIRR
jgi:hypothetical protein